MTERAKEDSDKLFRFEVFLIGGPISEEFAEENEVVSRTIEIRGDQTLEDLHRAIFEAFDREEEHMYEFQIGGRGPQDPNARRYVLPAAMDGTGWKQSSDGKVTETTIGSLGLEEDEAFGYWFDFGDDWWHQINVVSVEDGIPPGDYPKVTERAGDSPPQYPQWDDKQ